MSESFENNKNDLPNEDAKKWDILSEDTEVPEGEYDAASTENPDGTEMQMSVPEENLPHREVYETTAVEDYDGHWRFDTMDQPEMRNAIQDTMRQRARLAKQGLTPMDVFCRMENTTPGSAYPEFRTASGIFDGQLEDLIELSIDEQTTAEEVMQLSRYSNHEIEYDVTLSDEQKQERGKKIDAAIFESFLEHAGEDFFARDDSSALHLLNIFLENSRRYGFKNHLDLIRALKGKFTFGKSADQIITSLEKASSAPVANGGGESVFTDPKHAEALEEGMSPEVKAKVVSSIIEDGSIAGVIDALPTEQITKPLEHMSPEVKAKVVSSIIEDDKSIAGVIDALPPEQIAKLLKLVSAKAEDISTNDAQL